MARKYVVWDAATGALNGTVASVASGTALKTLMQIKPSAPIRIFEWGYSFDVTPTALVTVSLVVTGTVAGTLGTAFGNGDFAKFDSGQPNPSIDLTVSGFNIATEGTVTTSRLLDGQLSRAQQFVKQLPWEREFVVATNDILRVRVTTGTSVNCLCYVAFEQD